MLTVSFFAVRDMARYFEAPFFLLPLSSFFFLLLRAQKGWRSGDGNGIVISGCIIRFMFSGLLAGRLFMLKLVCAVQL